MNKKYIKYINYIVNDLETPYFKNMMDSYGLSEKEYPLVLSKVFNQSVTIEDNRNRVYDTNDNLIYGEYSDGDWFKQGYDTNGKVTYFENSSGSGYWVKYEYDTNGKVIYSENSNGDWVKREYDNQGNKIYYEDSDGKIVDNR